jgi:predicted esterase
LFSVVAVITLNNCAQPDHRLLREKVFISEPLENRADSLILFDEDCVGYFANHFNFRFPDSISLNTQMLEKSTNLKWKDVSNDYEERIDFNKYHDTVLVNKVIYVIDVYTSISDCQKLLYLGSDDGIRLWLNGELVYGIHRGRTSWPDDIIPLKFRKGKNILIYKIEQGGGDWALYRDFDFEKLDDLLNEKKQENFAYLPDSCLLVDSATKLFLDKEKVYKHNLLDTIGEKIYFDFIWTNWIDGEENEIQLINGKGPLPDYIEIPEKFNGFGTFQSIVYNEEKEKVYSEEIPIVFKSKAEDLVNLISKDNRDLDPNSIARKRAIIDLFHLNLKDSTNQKVSYNSRIKTHALQDFYIDNHSSIKNIRISGPRIMGFQSGLSDSVYMYRLYVPEELENKEKPETVFIVSHIEKESSKLLHGAAGQKFYVTLMNEMSTLYNSLIISTRVKDTTSNIEESLEEINIIYEQMKKDFNTDSDGISIFTDSNGALLVLELLLKTNIRVKMVGMPAPALNVSEEKLRAAFVIIKKKFPNIVFFVRQGLLDETVPVERVDRAVTLMREAGFEVDYKKIKHGTHYLEYDLILQEFLEKIDD